MEKVLSKKELSRLEDNLSKVKYQCKRCGRKMVIPERMTKRPCSWCGYYIFKNDKDEFAYRMNERLRSIK